MLDELRRQLVDLPVGSIGEAEILLVHEKGQVASSALEEAVAARGPWPAEIRHLPTGRSGYYEQKNFGAESAGGDIILFVDSDVVPEPGWLEALLAPFGDSDIGVVAGATSVEQKNLYSKAMALGWIFPLPPLDRSLRASRLFYANNVAFRKALMPLMRFPETVQYRVQVGAVHRALEQAGQPVVMSGAAAVLHPPPQGLGGFAARALWCGFDASTGVARNVRGFLRDAPILFAADAAAAVRRVVRDRRKVGLNVVQTAAAAVIVAGYHAVRGLGFVCGLAAPRITRRHLARIAP